MAQARSFSSTPMQNLNEIRIPPELGFVIETHASASPEAPLLIHIQEAHTNYEGQKHLAAILEDLIKQYGVKLVLVEGGHGDLSLSYMRHYGPPENRKEVAEKYLKNGIFSGEEYLDVASDYPLTLWGIEEDKLYQANVRAFEDAEATTAPLTSTLTAIHELTDALKPHLLPTSLIALEEHAKQFEEGALPIAAYVDFLAGIAPEALSETTYYPNLVRFRAVKELQGNLDQAELQQQQVAFTQRLAQSLDDTQRKELRAQTQQVNAGTLSREQFYTHLQELAARPGISLEEYPTLSRHIRSLQVGAQVQPVQLSEELDRLVARLRDRLASTPESQELQRLIAEAALIHNFINLRLSPDEYQRIQSLDVGVMLPRWTAFLTDQAQRYGLPVPGLQNLQTLQSAIPTLHRFYDGVNQRDEAMVRNAMAKLHETGESIAVLITGGFHSPQITQLLKDQGVGIMVVAPKVSGPTNDRLYRAVLKYKAGHGSLDEIRPAANPLQ